jgi:hypothetical protein
VGVPPAVVLARELQVDEREASMQHLSRFLVPALALAVGTGVLGAAEQPVGIKKFDALAVNFDGPAGVVAGPVQIQITRWTTDAERDALATALKDHGSEEMLKVLSKLPRVGSIRTPYSVGYPLRYAKRSTLDTKEQIVVVTDRPMYLAERRANTRSRDYPFTVVELRMGPDGVGEGRMAVPAKVIVDADGNLVSVENLTLAPILLQNVRQTQD